MKRLPLAVTSLALAIALGAFGTHSPKGRLSEGALEVFKTAQQYHVWMSLAWIALIAANVPGRTWVWLTGVGAVLFSGSLYALALTGARWLGAVTPLGGAALISGLLVAAWCAVEAKKRPPVD